MRISGNLLKKDEGLGVGVLQHESPGSLWALQGLSSSYSYTQAHRNIKSVTSLFASPDWVGIPSFEASDL